MPGLAIAIAITGVVEESAGIGGGGYTYKFLLENGTDMILLEDGTSFLLLE